MSETKRKVRAIREALRMAWATLSPDADAFPAEALRRCLSNVLASDSLDEILGAFDAESIGDAGGGVESVVDALGGELRRDEGIYLTPGPLADALARPATRLDDGDTVVDLSCGAGDLLLAAARHAPGARMVGVELQPALALVAAARLVHLRRRQGVACVDTIIVGDGLARTDELRRIEGEASFALGNPPYVREKGNRARFQRIRAQHSHLERHWAGRMDLQYLFMHRSVDYVRPGGWVAFLTSAYWLTATNARQLRSDLGERVEPRAVVDVRGAGVFDDAPGHHTLLTWFRRGGSKAPPVAACVGDAEAVRHLDIDSALDGQPSGNAWSVAAARDFEPVAWTPFLDEHTRTWGTRWAAEGTPLGELLQDRQGFVSGADSINAWNVKKVDEDVSRGEPIFLFEGEPPERFGRGDGTVVRPVLRGSRLEPNDVWVQPPAETWVLYLDEQVGADQEERVEAQLGAYRPILESRREARTGAMPWYRLHWPRARAEQTGPKLVVPRRAPRPAFALDLSASMVSSDCTYLVAPDGVRDPLRYLVVLMVLLNRAESERYLREFGKTKGSLLEFYSEPLRRLPLPVLVGDGELRLNRELLADTYAEVEQEIESVLEALA